MNELGDADFSSSDRQFLYDLQRLDSSERRRSAFHAIDRFTELASRCSDVVAFNVADRIRARILVMREVPLLDMPLVMKAENHWNSAANHDEVLFAFDPANPSRVDALWSSWGGQLEATRIARDTLVAHHARKRLISVSR